MKMGYNDVTSKSAEALLFVNIGDISLISYSFQARFVRMGYDVLDAKIVLVPFVNVGDKLLNARSAEALLCVNIGDNGLIAYNLQALLFVRMGDDVLDENSAVVLFVSVGVNILNARSAEALLCVQMGDIVLNSMIVEEF